MIVLFENITNPSSGNIFLFYLHHFHPQPHPQPLTSPPAGFSDLHGGVCKQGAGGRVGGTNHAYLYSYFEQGCRKICALDNRKR